MEYRCFRGYGGNSFQYNIVNLGTSLGPDSPTEFDAGTLSTSEANLNIDISRYYNFANDSEYACAGDSQRQTVIRLTQANRVLTSMAVMITVRRGKVLPALHLSRSHETRDNTGVYVELENLGNHWVLLGSGAALRKLF